VNCSAIPENLFEAELFGYEKGAFTGASSSRAGLIEKANHGILFLDEIGDMPIVMQPKILRVLQEKKVRRLGSNQEIQVNFRLICATNRDLRKLISEGKFREDLYYRISTIHIHLPPLRERKEDIPELVNCIIRKVSKDCGKTIKGYTEGFIKKIMNYPWPGNVRELENVLLKAVALSSSGILREEDLKLNYEEENTTGDFETYIRREVRKLIKESPGNVYHKLINMISKIIVEEGIKEAGYNQLLASKLLGINRLTLRKKLKDSLG
ncbi:MAG: sigma 54-interacting transcriptional regulator, partial [Aquificota bacterium]|nr:sigma 54-interacting transcriptional regulator [Aquificota bacterium]